MEGDERAALIRRRKGTARINQEIVRRPMPRQRGDGTLLLGAYADLLAVAAIFRSQNELLLNLSLIHI